MPDLTPRYLVDIATQIGFLSAFLGGFAATMLVALLLHEKRQRVVSVAIGLAACSATAFIVAVIGATDLIAQLHPDAIPGHTTAEFVRIARVMMGLSFGLGIYALFGCIGVCGWIRSFAIGCMTTAIGAIGVICVSIIISR